MDEQINKFRGLLVSIPSQSILHNMDPSVRRTHHMLYVVNLRGLWKIITRTVRPIIKSVTISNIYIAFYG